MPITLSNDQMSAFNALGSADQAPTNQIVEPNPMAQQSTGLSPAQIKALGFGKQPTPVVRQPDQQFNGSEYSDQSYRPDFQPTPTDTMINNLPAPLQQIEKAAINGNEVTQENMDVYNNAGDSNIGPLRFQHLTDPASGNKSTTVVPPPGTTGLDRVVGGGLLDFLKGLGEAFGAAADAQAMPGDMVIKALGGNTGNVTQSQIDKAGLTNSDKLAPQLATADPSLLKWVQENFPTMPAQNDLERQAQEMTGSALGWLSGEKVTSDAIQGAPGVLQKMTNLFARGVSKVDPANLPQKVNTFVKAGLIEMGGNLGATVAQPDNSGSLTGTAAHMLTGQDNTDYGSEKLGQLVDNTLLSAAGRGAKYLLNKSPIKSTVDSVTKSLKGSGAVSTMTADLIKQIDPSIKNASAEEFNRRATILKNLLESNADTKIGDTIWTSSPTAVLNRVGKQYFEQAYSFMKPHMTPEEWNAFVKEQSTFMPNEIESVRRRALNDPMSSVKVSTENAKYSRQTEEALGSIADKNAGPAQVRAASNELANTVATPLNDLKDQVAASEANKNVADANLNSAKSNALFAPVQTKFENPSPFQTVTSQHEQTKALAEDLIKRSIAEDDLVNSLHNNIPDNLDFDSRPIAKAIKNANVTDRVSRLLNKDQTPSIVKKMAPAIPGQAGTGPVQKKMAEIDGNWTLKDLINKVRPDASKAIGEIQAAAMARGGAYTAQDIDQIKALTSIKNAIDTQAYNSGSPEIKAAFDAHAKEQNMFHPSQELHNLSVAANSAKNRPGEAGFKSDQRQSAYNIIDDIQNGTDKSGEKLANYIRVIGNNPEAMQSFGQNLVDRLHTNLAEQSQSGKVSAANLIHGTKHLVAGIRSTLGDAIPNQFDAAINTLRQSEIDAEKAAADHAAVLASTTKQTRDLQQKIAHRLVETDSTGRVVPTGNHEQVLKNIFNNYNQTKDLMDAAEAQGPHAEAAIRAQYARHHAASLMTSKIESAASDGAFSRVPSASGLDKTDTGASHRILDEVFRNAPDEGGDIKILDQLLHEEAQARQIRPNTTSSNTAPDLAAQRKQYVSMAIQHFWGFMNPVATQIRRGTNLALSGLSQKEIGTRADIIPALVSDIHEFTRGINEITKNPSLQESVFRRMAKLSQANPLFRAYLNAQRPEYQRPDDRTNAALGTVKKRVNSVK